MYERERERERESQVFTVSGSTWQGGNLNGIKVTAAAAAAACSPLASFAADSIRPVFDTQSTFAVLLSKRCLKIKYGVGRPVGRPARQRVVFVSSLDDVHRRGNQPLCEEPPSSGRGIVSGTSKI